MKNYNLNDINKYIVEKGLKNHTIDLEDEKSYNIEEFDSAKTRILKYVLYKKRTEREVRIKFSSIYSEELLDNVIDNLKELNYIDDESYVERAVNEFISLKNLSIKELKYKLLSKGISSNLIETYLDNHYDELLEYEVKSASNICSKKKNSLDENELKIYLIKKGYREESIKGVL